VRSREIFEVAYQEAKQCEPGCYCDTIMVEYSGAFSLEGEIKSEIEELERTLAELRG